MSLKDSLCLFLEIQGPFRAASPHLKYQHGHSRCLGASTRFLNESHQPQGHILQYSCFVVSVVQWITFSCWGSSPHIGQTSTNEDSFAFPTGHSLVNLVSIVLCTMLGAFTMGTHPKHSSFPLASLTAKTLKHDGPM